MYKNVKLEFYISTYLRVILPTHNTKYKYQYTHTHTYIQSISQICNSFM